MVKLKLVGLSSFKDKIGIAVIMLGAFLATATPIMSLNYSAIVVFLFFLCAVLMLWKTRKINKKKFLLGMCMCLSLLCTAIVNADSDWSHYVGMVLRLWTPLMMSEIIEYSKFRKWFCNITLFISLYSIIITLFLNVNLQLLATLPTVTVEDSDGVYWKNFYNIYYIWRGSEWNSYVKNSAIFREPGVWGSIVSFALILKILNLPSRPTKRDWCECLIMFVAGALSLSTTCFFTLSLCVFYLVIRDRKIKFYKLAVIVLAVAALFLYVYPRADILFSKLSSSSSTYISFAQRAMGIEHGMESWLENLLLGSGLTKFNENMTSGNCGNTFVAILGNYGIVLFLMIVLYGYKGLKKAAENKLGLMFLCMILFLSLWNEDLLLYPLFLIWTFYGCEDYMNYKKIEMTERCV